jgi:hypothetical protein
MKEEDPYDHFKTYLISIDRESLNTLMGHFSDLGFVDVGVESSGEISFNLSKNSKLNVNEINIVSELFNRIETLEKKMSGLKEGGSAYLKAEAKRDALILTIGEVIDIYKKKLGI